MERCGGDLALVNSVMDRCTFASSATN
jgi:hypothetical protein